MSRRSVMCGVGLLALCCVAAARGSDTPMFSFGLFADPQYCDCDTSMGRVYRDAPARLSAAVEEFNARDLSFVVNLGDLIDRDFSGYDTMLALLGRVKAPVYHVVGNHDFEVAPRSKARVRRRLGLRRGYYEFRRERWRFVVLDGNEVSMYAHREGTRRHRAARDLHRSMADRRVPNAVVWSGAMGRRQLSWLERRLKRASRAGDRVIVLSHFPVYPPDRHNLWNAERLLEILRPQRCVAAYVSGHNHAGGYGCLDGTHFVTLSAMVDTDTESAFAVVDVYPDRLEIIGWGRQKGYRLDIDSGQK